MAFDRENEDYFDFLGKPDAEKGYGFGQPFGDYTDNSEDDDEGSLETVVRGINDPLTETTADDVNATDESRLEEALAAAGISFEPADIDLENTLRQAGVDVDAPEIQSILQNYPDLLQDERAAFIIQSMAQQYPAPEQTSYEVALTAAGFGEDPFFKQQMGTGYETGAAQALLQGQMPGQKAPTMEVNDQTGWLRYANGVLVDPESRSVVFDPNSKAAGSPTWQRDVVAHWGPDKVSEWKDRLHKFGYLSKDQSKGDTVDTVFMNAIVSYHQNRYINGGKPLAGDLTGVGGGGSAADRPKPINLNDFAAQIRNDVREQYRRVYGIDPSAGEVETWSSYIISQGMAMQRTNIKKYDTPMTESASAEAEESFIEKLENRPDARFLRDSVEENTRLRDTFDRMAQVTSSLAS